MCITAEGHFLRKVFGTVIMIMMGNNCIEENDLISVIVPVYNTERYLRKCLDSLCRQTNRNLEIILVDDGSTDDSGSIADEYARADHRIRVIHQENGGLSAARNAGISVANGTYIGFVDSDDYISERMYETLYQAIVREKAAIAICSYDWVDEEGNLIPHEKYIRNGVLTSVEAQEKLNQIEGNYYYTTVWNRLYKREVFDLVTFPVGRWKEDEFVAHELFYRAERIATVSASLYFYVQRKGSIMRSKGDLRNFDGVLALYQRCCFYRDHGLEQVLPAAAKRLELVFYNVNRGLEAAGKEECDKAEKALERKLQRQARAMCREFFCRYAEPKDLRYNFMNYYCPMFIVRIYRDLKNK